MTTKKYPLEGRILKPFKYTPASSTDIAKTFREARKALEAKERPHATNVQPFKHRRAA